MNTRLVYKHFKIPVTYIDVDYEDLDISKTKAAHLRGKMKSAPPKGLLFIKGSAAPVVNQLYGQGRSIRGINFVEHSDDAFGTHAYPTADVVLIYNLGSEVSTNYNVSRQVLQKLLRYYKSQNTLVVVETHFAKSEVLHNYDVSTGNFLTLDDRADDVWI